jgi:hypothetical protein
MPMPNSTLAGRTTHRLAAAVVACTLATWPAQAPAQGDYAREDGRALVLSLHGGQFGPLTHLDDQAWVEFKTGSNLGGSLAYRLNRHLALRSAFTFVRAEVRDASSSQERPIGGVTFNRYFYDADLQLRYPLRDGMTPYAFLGGGTLTVRRDTPGEASRFTKGALRLGGGLGYQIPRTDVGLFIQGAGWIYKWDRYGFDRVQFDTTLSGGISYRFRL